MLYGKVKRNSKSYKGRRTVNKKTSKKDPLEKEHLKKVIN